MNSTTAITPTTQNSIIPMQTGGAAAFEEMAGLTLRTVAASSARVYGQTFRAWAAWAAANGHDATDIRPAAVLAFLQSEDVTRATRQRQLSAFRKLAQTAYALTGDEHLRRMYEALKMVKVASADNAASSGKERTRRALLPREADRVLHAWDTPGQQQPTTDAEKRNAALIAVLALTGLRRSEAAALQWHDVDFENAVVTVRHGKGDKERVVPFAADIALEALRAWQVAQPTGYTHVFTPFTIEREHGADKPISGMDVYRIVKATEKRIAVTFNPHDLRRTLITEALATGAQLRTVQAIAGHSRAETTLRYAQAVDAIAARKELRLRYGG